MVQAGAGPCPGGDGNRGIGPYPQGRIGSSAMSVASAWLDTCSGRWWWRSCRRTRSSTLPPRVLGRCRWRRWSCCGWRTGGRCCMTRDVPGCGRRRWRTCRAGSGPSSSVVRGPRRSRSSPPPSSVPESGAPPTPRPRLIADAQDLHHRHPVLWARVVAGEVRASYARHVVAKTRHLSATEAGFVDAEVAESADGRIPWRGSRSWWPARSPPPPPRSPAPRRNARGGRRSRRSSGSPSTGWPRS